MTSLSETELLCIASDVCNCCFSPIKVTFTRINNSATSFLTKPSTSPTDLLMTQLLMTGEGER